MESRSYLDTHTVIWLHAERFDLLSNTAAEAIDNDELRISPFVLFEIELLREIGRFTDPGTHVVDRLASRIGLLVCDVPFARVIDATLALGWTRDPFDRVIVGQAIAGNGALITRDNSIREHFENAIW